MSKTPPKLGPALNSMEFARNKYDHYRWMLEEAPVCRVKVSVVRMYLVAPYEECLKLVKSPRFVRDRGTATGKGRLPIPLPRSVETMMSSLIQSDGDVHRRQRGLVHQAFTNKAVNKLQGRIERLTHELIDGFGENGSVDLLAAYALPIPVTVIKELLGVPEGMMPRFMGGFRALTTGMTGLTLLKTLLWDMPKLSAVVGELIEMKRVDPGDDILTGLIHAEEDGDRLTTDELISLTFVLIVAGYETTVHLIGNVVLTLLQHPEDLERIRADRSLIQSAIEEVLRFNGPIQGSKPEHPMEDVEICGYAIPKGAMVIPAYGAANRDATVFDHPERFDIERSPNKHLGFGHGPHFCLGAMLARLETRIALESLLDRFDDIRLAVPESELKVQPLPLWHRYESLPLICS